MQCFKSMDSIYITKNFDNLAGTTMKVNKNGPQINPFRVDFYYNALNEIDFPKEFEKPFIRFIFIATDYYLKSIKKCI